MASILKALMGIWILFSPAALIYRFYLSELGAFDIFLASGAYLAFFATSIAVFQLSTLLYEFTRNLKDFKEGRIIFDVTSKKEGA